MSTIYISICHNDDLMVTKFILIKFVTSNTATKGSNKLFNSLSKTPRIFQIWPFTFIILPRRGRMAWTDLSDPALLNHQQNLPPHKNLAFCRILFLTFCKFSSHKRAVDPFFRESSLALFAASRARAASTALLSIFFASCRIFVPKNWVSFFCTY